MTKSSDLETVLYSICATAYKKLHTKIKVRLYLCITAIQFISACTGDAHAHNLILYILKIHGHCRVLMTYNRAPRRIFNLKAFIIKEIRCMTLKTITLRTMHITKK